MLITFSLSHSRPSASLLCVYFFFVAVVCRSCKVVVMESLLNNPDSIRGVCLFFVVSFLPDRCVVHATFIWQLTTLQIIARIYNSDRSFDNKPSTADRAIVTIDSTSANCRVYHPFSKQSAAHLTTCSIRNRCQSHIACKSSLTGPAANR